MFYKRSVSDPQVLETRLVSQQVKCAEVALESQKTKQRRSSDELRAFVALTSPTAQRQEPTDYTSPHPSVIRLAADVLKMFMS